MVGPKVTFGAIIDKFAAKIPVKIALECYGYVGNNLLWVGLSKGQKGKAQVFDYNTKTKQFRELRHMRIPHEVTGPAKLAKIGNEFYYTGVKGNIKKLDFIL